MTGNIRVALTVVSDAVRDSAKAPADRKKRLQFDTGHGNLPRFQVEKATLEWLDEHLGAATGDTAR